MRAETRAGGWYHRAVVYLLFLILLLPWPVPCSTRWLPVGRPACCPAA